MTLGHVIDVRHPSGWVDPAVPQWAMEHPADCHLRRSMTDCPIFRAAERTAREKAAQFGRAQYGPHRCRLRTDGGLDIYGGLIR